MHIGEHLELRYVLRALGEVDDVEEPENDRETEAQQRILGAVDQPSTLRGGPPPRFLRGASVSILPATRAR